MSDAAVFLPLPSSSPPPSAPPSVLLIYHYYCFGVVGGVRYESIGREEGKQGDREESQ